MQFGMIGLGTMGRNFLLNVAEHGFSGAGYDLDAEKRRLLLEEGENFDLQTGETLADFLERLESPKKIMILVPAQVVDFVINDLLGALNKAGKDIENVPVSPVQLGAVIDLIKEGTISGKIAKDLFEIVWNEGGDPRAIVERRGMKQVTDTGAIEKAIDDVIAANPDKVEQAKAKPTLAGWFVGQVMKATGGKANPQAVNDLVKAKLGIE